MKVVHTILHVILPKGKIRIAIAHWAFRDFWRVVGRMDRGLMEGGGGLGVVCSDSSVQYRDSPNTQTNLLPVPQSHRTNNPLRWCGDHGHEKLLPAVFGLGATPFGSKGRCPWAVRIMGTLRTHLQYVTTYHNILVRLAEVICLYCGSVDNYFYILCCGVALAHAKVCVELVSQMPALIVAL